MTKALSQKQNINTWQERDSDHKGGFHRAWPIHCTLNVLTRAFPPNMGNLTIICGNGELHNGQATSDPTDALCNIYRYGCLLLLLFSRQGFSVALEAVLEFTL